MDGTTALMLTEALLILLGVSISKAIRFISPSLDANQHFGVDDDSSNDEVIFTQSLSPPTTKFDVFLSFRGEDTRDNFSSHLYEALRNAGIQTFMDHKLYKGDNISPILLKTIEESEISLIIFSKDYASSSWCMDELVHIMKCKDQHGRIVIPIFYHVDPSGIRKQNGSFGDGFAKLKRRFKHNQKKLQEWTNALNQSTNLSGWDSKKIRPESKLTKKIVNDVLSKLNSKSSFHVEGLVGIGHHIQKTEELMREARIVGIWGMGGIGKTTLATAVFDKLKAQFDAFSFVRNVRERLARKELDELLEKCLKDLLKDEGINTYNLRSNYVKNRLHRKKILLVLDDVDESIENEDLMEACGWFGEGSRIIITSRDIHVLLNDTSASVTYHVKKLDPHHALNLFSLKAFKQNEPMESHLELLNWALGYCEGNPLALIVLGRYLHGRGKEEWESAMEELNQAPQNGIFNVLKLSFDGLNETQKNVFLDLAFFLKEAWWISLDCTRQLYGSSAQIVINVLKERSLISVNEYGYIEMHALLMDMGLQISRQPKKPIRLRRHEDIYHFFNNHKGIEAIRLMSLDSSKIKGITWRASDFRKMYNLVFLKVYKCDRSRPSKLNICEDLDYLPEELMFFSWEDYPLPNVPLHFCAESLIILRLRNSNIRQLGNGNELHFPNLKAIGLEYSKHLMALPDLCHAPKIECIDLDGCVSLAQIHSSIVPTVRDHVELYVNDSGPAQIRVGGSMKGTSSSVLVAVSSYLDLVNLSLHKVTMKVLACGNIISGIRFKHVEVPLEEKAELRSLASLLPFVRKLDWLERLIECGRYFNQHHSFYAFTYDYGDFTGFKFEVKGRGDRGEGGAVGPFINYDKVSETTATTLTEEEEELIMEYCYRGSNSATLLFIRLPITVTRWSLMTKLRFKKRDIIGNAQLSILNSLSHHAFKRNIKPLLDVKLSFLSIPPSALPHSFCISYSSDIMPLDPRCPSPYLRNFRFFCDFSNLMSDSSYGLTFGYHSWW